MKRVFIILLMVLASQALLDFRPEKQMALKRLILVGRECAVGSAINESQFIDKEEFQALHARGAECFQACLYRGIGILNVNGSLNETVISDDAKFYHGDNERTAQNLERLLSVCKNIEISSDICETSKRYEDCVKQNKITNTLLDSNVRIIPIRNSKQSDVTTVPTPNSNQSNVTTVPSV